MDQKLGRVPDFKEKLLPPEHMPAAASVVEMSPAGTPGGFAPTARIRVNPGADSHGFHCHYRDADHADKSGGSCRIATLIFVALAVCAGFGLLYARMASLERQVQMLTELTAALEEDPWAYDEAREWQAEPGNSDDEKPNNIDGSTRANEASNDRVRRSAGEGASHRGVRTVRTHHQNNHHGQHSDHVFAHLTPLIPSNTGQVYREYDYSEFFEWSDSAQYAFNQLQLENNKFLVVPFTGYYYIYSQATVSDVSNGRAKGHSLWVRSRCGQPSAQWQELSYTLTTQANGTSGLAARDSNFLGGVFLLRQHDHVGVKPRPHSTSTNRVRFLRTELTDYFGAIMLTRLPAAAATCSHNHRY